MDARPSLESAAARARRLLRAGHTSAAAVPALAECPAGPELVVVGSVSSDRLHLPGSPVVATVGGAGLYAALGAAVVADLGGAQPRFRVGVVGLVSDDVDPVMVTRLGERFDTAGLLRVPGRAVRFDIAYDTTGRAEYHEDGAEAEALLDPRLIPPHYWGARGFHLCPTGPAGTQLAFARALRGDPRAARAVLSATTFRHRIATAPQTVRAVWNLVDVFVLNAEEAQLLTGQPTVDAAVKQVAHITNTRASRAGGPRVTVVTEGAHGAHVAVNDTVLSVPAYPARTVDPTGAGESFAGAFLAACLTGDLITGPADSVADGLRRAGAVAAVVAARAVEGFGPAALLAAAGNGAGRHAAAVASPAAAPDGFGGG